MLDSVWGGVALTIGRGRTVTIDIGQSTTVHDRHGRWLPARRQQRAEVALAGQEGLENDLDRQLTYGIRVADERIPDKLS